MLVTLENSDISFDCSKDQTILAAALAQGIELARACEVGTCGMCRSKVVSGSVCHSDKARALTTSDAALGRALLCCAYPKTDLVIEATIQERTGQAAASIPARVVAMESPTADVKRVTLRFPPQMSPRFEPGQFLHIAWKDGPPRAFSIANRPREDGTVELQIGRKWNGNFTRHVFEEMKPGDLLRVSGPYGNFRFQSSGKPVVFVAGGTGIAPIFAMLENMSSDPPDIPVSLYWGCRGADGFYLAEELRSITQRFPQFDLHTVVSEPRPDWSGRTGFVHEACFADIGGFDGLQLYACGNPMMIDALERGALSRGMPPQDFFADKFN